MATKKTEKKEINTEKLGDMAKDLYLANLGMYGKLYETLEDKVEAYNDKRGDLFKDLVKRGEKVHKNAEKRIKEFDLTKEVKLEDRIQELRDNFDSLKDKLVSGNKNPVAKKKAPARKAPSKAKAPARKAKAEVAEEVAA